MNVYKQWEDAHTEAQKRANSSGLSVGIEKLPPFGGYSEGFKIYFLPTPKRRYGHELRCEVVDPTIARARGES